MFRSAILSTAIVLASPVAAGQWTAYGLTGGDTLNYDVETGTLFSISCSTEGDSAVQITPQPSNENPNVPPKGEATLTYGKTTLKLVPRKDLEGYSATWSGIEPPIEIAKASSYRLVAEGMDLEIAADPVQAKRFIDLCIEDFGTGAD